MVLGDDLEFIRQFVSADLVNLEEIDIIRLLGHTEVPDAIDLAS